MPLPEWAHVAFPGYRSGAAAGRLGDHFAAGMALVVDDLMKPARIDVS
jgi:hypothetical protein